MYPHVHVFVYCVDSETGRLECICKFYFDKIHKSISLRAYYVLCAVQGAGNTQCIDRIHGQVNSYQV